MQVVLRAAMTCVGCSSAVKRVLSKATGVESFDVLLVSGAGGGACCCHGQEDRAVGVGERRGLHLSCWRSDQCERALVVDKRAVTIAARFSRTGFGLRSAAPLSHCYIYCPRNARVVFKDAFPRMLRLRHPHTRHS